MRAHPVIERELVQAARKSSTHVFRFLFGIAAGVATLTLMLASAVPTARNGMALLHIITAASFIFCLLAGLIFTADSLASERREGTLPLLFLSGMGALEIVLAKWVSNGWRCLTMVVLPMPFLATSLCLGGVEPSQLAGVLFGILFLACFSLTAGLLLSSLGLSGGGGLLLYAGLMIPGTTGLIIDHLMMGARPRPEWMLIFNPAHPLLAAWLGPYGLVPKGLVAESLGMGCALLVLMLALAGLALKWSIRPPFWMERLIPTPRGRGVAGNPSKRRQISATDFLPASLSTRWLFTRVGLGMAALAGVVYARRADQFFEGSTAGWLLLAAHFMAKTSRAWLAARIGWMEINSRGMELLLTTPISAGEILSAGKRRLDGAFAWMDLVVVLLHLVYLAFEVWTGRVGDAGAIVSASLLIFVVDRRTVSWIGMWAGFTGRGLFRSAVTTWVQSGLGPCLIALGGYALLKAAFGAGFPDPGVAVLTSIWVAAAGLASGLASARMWRCHANMRTIAATSG